MATRNTYRINSDQMEKLWEELNKKDSHTIKIEKRELQRNVSEVEKKKQQFGNVSDRAQQRIARCISLYRLSNINRFSIEVAEKVRSDFKEKLVHYLLYAIEELREVSKNLNEAENKIIDLSEKQSIELVRGIAI